MPSLSDCHGCALCLLSCPMWRQRRDVRFSPQGFARSMQHGAEPDDMQEILSACVMCGACDVLCPENIELTAMIATGLQQRPPEKSDDAFTMSCDPDLRKRLSSSDLYIIDAPVFHAQHAERIKHYDTLRRATRCQMNLDLNRMAIPTGIGSLSESLQMFDSEKQIEWLIRGRKFTRIIVENRGEIEMLSEITGRPALHISELLERGNA